MNRMTELRDQSQEELKAQYGELSKDIYNLKNEISMTKKLDKPHLLREKKKKRARILTTLREKEGQK